MRFRLRTLMILLAVAPPIVAWVSLRYMRRYSKAAVAEQRLSLLNDAVNLYCLDMGAPPASLDDLVALPPIGNPAKWAGPYLEQPLAPRDPWGQPFGYKIIDSRKSTFRVWSNGTDRQPGTSDDIAIGK